MSETVEQAKERYLSAAHAMQSGVAMMMNYDADETARKHLRVGVNSAMVDVGSLAKLLIGKGIITEQEYLSAVADGMEREVDMYTEQIQNIIGSKVTLR